MKNRVEISMREIFIFSLKRWWIVLLSMVVIGSLFTVISLRKQKETVHSIQTEYDKTMAEYREKEEKNSELLSEATKQRDDLAEYMNNSVLMRVLPQKVKQSTVNVSILREPWNYVELITIGEHYNAYAKDTDYHAIFSNNNKDNLGNRYLSEMVDVTRGQTDLMTITVKGRDDDDTESLAKLTYEYLLNKREQIIKDTGFDHELKVISSATKVSPDTATLNLQYVVNQNLAALEAKVNALITEKPSVPVYPEYSLYKTILTGILLGVVTGAVFILFLYVIIFSVQYIYQPQNQLGLRFLGNMRPKNNKNNLVDGQTRLQDEKEALEFTMANINDVLTDRKSILLTGTIPQAKIEQFARGLNDKYKECHLSVSFGSNVLDSANTVSLLSRADAVIIVESVNRSRIRQINLQKERIEQSAKPILGYVIV